MSEKADCIMSVAEMKASERERPVPFEAILVIRAIEEKTAKNGSPYFRVELGDKTGAFSTMCFSDTANFIYFQQAQTGEVIRVRGKTGYFRDRFSPSLDFADRLPEDEAREALSQLIPCSPHDPGALWDELQQAIARIAHEPLRQTVMLGLGEIGEGFRISTAAKAMHHAYRHGLLEHTVNMLRAASALLPLYPEVDADLALAGIVLHDIGKVAEYTGDFVTDRTREGILNGHVVLGYRVARKAALKARLDDSLRERLEHIILSHQGEPEWGAAVRAATPEAVFVSMVDNLDAKMGAVQQELRNAPEGREMSERVPALATHLLLTPVQKPEPIPEE